jgi:hypothetical protein
MAHGKEVALLASTMPGDGKHFCTWGIIGLTLYSKIDGIISYISAPTMAFNGRNYISYSYINPVNDKAYSHELKYDSLQYRNTVFTRNWRSLGCVPGDMLIVVLALVRRTDCSVGCSRIGRLIFTCISELHAVHR